MSLKNMARPNSIFKTLEAFYVSEILTRATRACFLYFFFPFLNHHHHMLPQNTIWKCGNFYNDSPAFSPQKCSFTIVKLKTAGLGTCSKYEQLSTHSHHSKSNVLVTAGAKINTMVNN